MPTEGKLAQASIAFHMNKQTGKVLRAFFAVFFASLVVLGIGANPAQAVLTEVGPVADPVNNGFPAWFGDANGIRLQLCLDQDLAGLCLLTPEYDPAVPGFSSIGTVASGNFPDESFYFNASVDLSPAQGGTILWQAALEQAFLGGIVPGTQNIFLRLQVDISNMSPNETYNFETPYGPMSLITDEDGGGRTRFEDMGECVTVAGQLVCTFADPLPINNPVLAGTATHIGPFLRWDGANPAPPAGFIGDPNILHSVTGGLGGFNEVTVTGPNAGGTGDPTGSTDLFSVSGKIAIIDTVPPVIVSTSPANAAIGSTDLVANAHLTDDLGVTNVTIDLGSIGNSFVASLNGNQVVPATGSAVTGSGTFTIDTTANTLSFNITRTALTGGTETAARIHGPAIAGATAVSVFNLPLGASKTGTWTYPENLEADILAGRIYVDISTTLFPNGEIRGQILPTTNIQSMVRTAGLATDGTWGIVIPNLDRLGTFSLPMVVTDGSNVTTGTFPLTVATPPTVSAMTFAGRNGTVTGGNTIAINLGGVTDSALEAAGNINVSKDSTLTITSPIPVDPIALTSGDNAKTVADLFGFPQAVTMADLEATAVNNQISVSGTLTDSLGLVTNITINISISNPSKIAVYDGKGAWYLDLSGNGAWNGTPTDKAHSFGYPGTTPVFGDWNGNGTSKIGVYDGKGAWYLDINGNGAWDGIVTDKNYSFGFPGTKAIAGNWVGSVGSSSKIGVYDGKGTWYLDMNGNGAWDGEPTDKIYNFGYPGTTPIVGDWDGNGKTEIGVYDGKGTWYVDINGNGAWDGALIDKTYSFGFTGTMPAAGDWDGNGTSKIGVYDGKGNWYLDVNGNGAWDGIVTDKNYLFGFPGTFPAAGTWN